MKMYTKIFIIVISLTRLKLNHCHAFVKIFKYMLSLVLGIGLFVNHKNDLLECNVTPRPTKDHNNV